MTLKNDLIGLPKGETVSTSLLKLRTRIETLGVEVVDDLTDLDHARFVGTFDDNVITIYPNIAPVFAQWFTIAHLYGHMTQMSNMNPRVERANSLVVQINKILSAEDIQLIYDHEFEAAEIGRALIEDVEPDISIEMDIAYDRFFHADFRYLINYIETGEQGVEVFARFWRREPITRELIKPDSRRLLTISEDFDTEKIVVV